MTQGFIDTFRHLNPKLAKYSYWNLRSGAREKNQGWRLDYFVTSQSMIQAGSATLVINSEINNEYHGSDHCPLSLTIRCNGGDGAEFLGKSIEIKEKVEVATVKEMMKSSVAKAPAPPAS